MYENKTSQMLRILFLKFNSPSFRQCAVLCLVQIKKYDCESLYHLLCNISNESEDFIHKALSGWLGSLPKNPIFDVKIPQKKPGYIYLIWAENTDRCKIGRTTNINVRVNKLIQQSPYPLVCIKHFSCDHSADDEKALHKKFASKRVHGEWFKLNAVDIESFYPIESYRFFALEYFRQLRLSLSLEDEIFERYILAAIAFAKITQDTLSLYNTVCIIKEKIDRDKGTTITPEVRLICEIHKLVVETEYYYMLQPEFKNYKFE